MYKEFFALRANPFSASPDPRYLFLTKHTEEALACLVYGIEGRKGFVLLTGEVGTGKTTLVHKVFERARQMEMVTAFIFNPRLNVSEFLSYMLADFGAPCESRSKDEILRHLNNFLLRRYQEGKTVVLVVDEAQNLSDELLEEIRLLTNLETSTEKLLQVVLVGQPELEEKLREPHLRQVRQRLVMRARTHPFSPEETEAYVGNRLSIAGSSHAIFESDALLAIHRYSDGIPRVINLLCEHCLITAFADEKKTISRDIVEAVARDFDLAGGATTNSTPPTINLAASERSGVTDAFRSLAVWLTHDGGLRKDTARKGDS